MTDALLIGACSIAGGVVLLVEAALSLAHTTRIFRIALGTALIGGLLSLALEPRFGIYGFLCGAAYLGSVGGGVCAIVMVIDVLARRTRVP